MTSLVGSFDHTPPFSLDSGLLTRASLSDHLWGVVWGGGGGRGRGHAFDWSAKLSLPSSSSLSIFLLNKVCISDGSATTDSMRCYTPMKTANWLSRPVTKYMLTPSQPVLALPLNVWQGRQGLPIWTPLVWRGLMLNTGPPTPEADVLPPEQREGCRPISTAGGGGDGGEREEQKEENQKGEIIIVTWKWWRRRLWR